MSTFKKKHPNLNDNYALCETILRKYQEPTPNDLQNTLFDRLRNQAHNFLPNFNKKQILATSFATLTAAATYVYYNYDNDSNANKLSF